MRFAPQLFASIEKDENGNPGLSVSAVIRAANDGLVRAKIEFNEEREARLSSRGIEGGNPPDPFYDYGIIVCAMRSFPPVAYYRAFLALHENLDYERICGLASETLINTAAKCRDEENIPIVALDVAGAEDGFPNKVHSHAFDIAHGKFFNKTVHAGEGYVRGIREYVNM